MISLVSRATSFNGPQVLIIDDSGSMNASSKPAAQRSLFEAVPLPAFVLNWAAVKEYGPPIQNRMAVLELIS